MSMLVYIQGTRRRGGQWCHPWYRIHCGNVWKTEGIEIMPAYPAWCIACPSCDVRLSRVVEVDWGLTSHSAIFQLYSDGTDVQFPNFDLLPGTQRHGQLGVFSVPSLPRHGHRDVRRRLLPPCHQRAHTRWGNLLCYHLSSQSWSIVCSCDRDWTFKVYHGGNDTCMDHKERVNPIVFQGQK